MSLQTVLQEALTLPVADRGALARELLASLPDEDAGDDWQPAWRAEITRRLDDLRAGCAEVLDADAVLDELEAELELGRR